MMSDTEVITILICFHFLMNMPAAIGAYCFFANKPEINFDFEVPEANGQLVLRQ